MLPFTRFRLLHWSLVIVFLVAYLTGDDGELLHVWTGYALIALLVVRLLVSLSGAAGFSPLIPRRATLRARNATTASRALVLALVLGIIGTSVSGVLMIDNARAIGLAAAQAVPAAHASDGDNADGDERDAGLIASGSLEELHEFLANATLALAGLHVVLLFGWRRPLALTTLFGPGRRRTASRPAASPSTPSAES